MEHTPANGCIFYFDKIDFFKFQSNTNSFVLFHQKNFQQRLK